MKEHELLHKDSLDPTQQVCGYRVEVSGPVCGNKAIAHAVVAHGDEVVDAGELGAIMDIARANPIYACSDHLKFVVKAFRYLVMHPVGKPCGQPDAVWVDGGCVFPGDGDGNWLVEALDDRLTHV